MLKYKIPQIVTFFYYFWTLTTPHFYLYIFFFLRNNAEAESFNAKIKAFRAQFRGVRIELFYIDLLIIFILLHLKLTTDPKFQTEPRISYGELYKTKIAIISFPMIAITSCTRSGT